MHNYVFCRQATYPVKYGMRKRGLDRIRFEVCRPTPPVQRRHLKDLAGNGHMFVRRVGQSSVRVLSVQASPLRPVSLSRLLSSPSHVGGVGVTRPILYTFSERACAS
jgi:hypothetical protein